MLAILLGISSLLPCLNGRELPRQPEPAFKFNCGQDICTFPIQYCDLTEARCQYCSDDLCLAENYPEQCWTYCQSLLPTETTPLVTTSVTVPTATASSSQNYIHGENSAALWSICGVLTLLTILILISILHYICTVKRKGRQRSPSLTKSGRHLSSPEHDVRTTPQTIDLPRESSTRMGGIQDSPTGRRAPHINQGDHELLRSDASFSSGSSKSSEQIPLLTQQPSPSGDQGPVDKLGETRIMPPTGEHASNSSSDSGYNDESPERNTQLKETFPIDLTARAKPDFTQRPPTQPENIAISDLNAARN